MYENLKSEKDAMPNEIRQPELIALTELLQDSVNRFDSLTCEINAKLQNIKRYSEPETKSEPNPESQPDSFAEAIRGLIHRININNLRLGFNLRHLNEII